MNRFLNAKRAYLLLFLLLCLFLPSMYAQQENGNPCNSSSRYLYWTGEVNNDFFNETNWRISNEIANPPNCLPGSNSFPYSICPHVPDPVNDHYPAAGSLEPGEPIRYNLLIDAGTVTANGSIVIACAQKGITMVRSQLNITQGTMSQGVLSLLGESTVHFYEGAFSPQLTLNFLDTASWVYMHQQNPDELMSELSRILVRNVAGTLDNNFRINQYYQQGAVIRPRNLSFSALKIFTALNQQGSSAELKEDMIYSGTAIPGGLNNATRSFMLKRGFMATFAVNSNGTGKSKVYIASETDMAVDALDVALQGNVSFIRVVPWNWVTKKGTGGFYNQLNAGWFYNWALNNNPQPNYEYVPMAWGASGALPASLDQIMQKKKTTHVLGFNESDNCADQSGQYNNLCQPAVAVAYYENLMSLGVRLGTPAPRENGPTSWLLDFARIAKEKDVRFDFVAVHWYDWGSNPASSPNASAQVIFNRFKAYLENVYNIYQLPIWITEFNANPNRGNATQEEFLQLALPYLESLNYVERYAFFQPNSGTANYLDAGGNLTNIGELYKNHTSTPSILLATYACPNNLEGLDQPYVPAPVYSLAFEAECGNYIGNQWSVLENAEVSNGLYIRGDNTLNGVTSLAKQVHFEFDLQAAGTYRAWIRAASTGGAGAIRVKIDGNEFEQISPFTSNSFTWFQVPRFYDLGEGKHRFSIEYPNSNILLDQVAFTNGPADLELYKQAAGYCIPSTLKWGLDATDLLSFYEAEAATKGIYWRTETSTNAAGGAFAASEENIVSNEAPQNDDKVLSFSFNIEKSDEYDIWAKIQATNPLATGLWISVDGEPFRKWNNLGNTTYAWYWKKFHYSYGAENRSFTYFLAAGQHQVKIAINSGHVFVDRLAVATKGKLPETSDPNVLAISESLEFEAEDATLLGNAAIVNCTTSSNGMQVNLFNVNTNRVRFDQIVAESAGAYKLKVSYMSAALRTFRVIVNGVILGRQNPPISGGWCFNAGSPAVYELNVILNRGINVIDITPFTGDAPFIDKIKLEKAALNGLTLEAETAELLGANIFVSCATASNLALVNMQLSTNNGVRFNNLLATETKNYLVDVHYITKTNRSVRISVNGQPFTTASFDASGNWCFEGGTTRVKTIGLELSQGNNSIEFRPTGSDAPFLDKIVIHEPVSPRGSTNFITNSVNSVPEVLIPEQVPADLISIYPNPIPAGAPINLSLPDALTAKGPVYIQITDVTGRIVFTQNLLQKNSGRVSLSNNLNQGIYLLTVVQGPVKTSKRIIVQ